MADVTVVAHDVGGVGGMELQLAELVRGLAAAGDHVTVIARAVTLPGVALSVHRVRGPARPFVIAYPWFALLASVLVAQHRRGTVQATGAIVLNRVDFVSIHFCHRALGRRVPGSSASRNTRLFRTHARAAGALSRFGEWLCMRPARVGGVIAVSPGVAAEVRTCYPALAHRVTVVANGVDRDRFSIPSKPNRAAARARFAIPHDACCAVFVGGDWGRKGLRVVLQALTDADRWVLLVAGRGDTRAYQRLADALHVATRVQFLGAVLDTPGVYHAGDAFVLPSEYETFSLVAYEAASCGLPLIATAVHGVEDILVDAVTGYRVHRDRAEVAQRLRQLADAPATARAMGAAARQATADYTWQQMVDRHRALYLRAAATS